MNILERIFLIDMELVFAKFIIAVFGALALITFCLSF